EPESGRHLVVARAPGMPLSAHRSDDLDEARLDVHVHVLARGIPAEAARFDLLANALEAADDGGDLVIAEQARAPEPARVGDGARDVLAPELRVDVDARVQPLHGGVDGEGQSPPSCEGHWLRSFRSTRAPIRLPNGRSKFRSRARPGVARARRARRRRVAAKSAD